MGWSPAGEARAVQRLVLSKLLRFDTKVDDIATNDPEKISTTIAKDDLEKITMIICKDLE